MMMMIIIIMIIMIMTLKTEFEIFCNILTAP